MSDKQYKLIRKQLRNVVQEILPDVLSNELVKGLNKDLSALVEQRLEGISKHVAETLSNIDARAKDIQTYMIRHAGTPSATPPTEVTPPTPENQQ